MGICEFIKWKFKCFIFEFMLCLVLNGVIIGLISCGNKVLRSFERSEMYNMIKLNY